MRIDALVVVKGGGDLASGVVYRLVRVGFPVIVTETAQPTTVRRSVAFGEAVYEGKTSVEGLEARLARSDREALALADHGVVPVLVDPGASCVQNLRPQAVVDGIMAKWNTGTRLADAPIVVGLGPGFTAGVDCHAAVETNRGHHLGRVIRKGEASPDTGIPGAVGGETERRIVRSPGAGTLRSLHAIGDAVRAGEKLAEVDGIAVLSQLDGVLRGMLHDGLTVAEGAKLGDVDPRADREHCFTISDKSLAVGGGVVEAIMSLWRREPVHRRPGKFRV